jgi:hypothetical protein
MSTFDPAFSLSKKTFMKRVLLACGASLFAYAAVAQQADCSDIFISEYVEGLQNNKAIELYNPTNQPINLGAGNYKMGRDRDGAGNPMLLPITGIIEPYGTRVFVLDKRDPNGTGNEVPVADELQAVADTFLNPVYVQSFSPMYFNGDDAFVLVKGTATILDIIGKIGEDPGGGWWEPGDPNTAWWTEDNTLIRKSAVKKGVLSNPGVFDPSLQWDSLPANTFTNLGVHACDCQIPDGLSERELTELTVFPNPIAHGELAIRANKEIRGYAIYSASGSLVTRREELGNARYYSVALPEAVTGVYFLEVWFADGSRIHRKLLAR